MFSLRLVFLLLLLGGFTDGSSNGIDSLPEVIIKEVIKFLGDKDLVKLRACNRVFHLSVEGAIKAKFGKDYWIDNHFRSFQLKLITSSAGPVTFTQLLKLILHPESPSRHIKLLLFMDAHSEFMELMASLRSDLRGFILPSIKYYGERIHGLDEFVRIFKCERHLVSGNNNNNKCNRNDGGWDDELGIFYFLLAFFEYIQG